MLIMCSIKTTDTNFLNNNLNKINHTKSEFKKYLNQWVKIFSIGQYGKTSHDIVKLLEICFKINQSQQLVV